MLGLDSCSLSFRFVYIFGSAFWCREHLLLFGISCIFLCSFVFQPCSFSLMSRLKCRFIYTLSAWLQMDRQDENEKKYVFFFVRETKQNMAVCFFFLFNKWKKWTWKKKRAEIPLFSSNFQVNVDRCKLQIIEMAKVRYNLFGIQWNSFAFGKFENQFKNKWVRILALSWLEQSVYVCVYDVRNIRHADFSRFQLVSLIFFCCCLMCDMRCQFKFRIVLNVQTSSIHRCFSV